jgi:hypothetical protein
MHGTAILYPGMENIAPRAQAHDAAARTVLNTELKAAPLIRPFSINAIQRHGLVRLRGSTCHRQDPGLINRLIDAKTGDAKRTIFDRCAERSTARSQVDLAGSWQSCLPKHEAPDAVATVNDGPIERDKLPTLRSPRSYNQHASIITRSCR